MFIKRNIAAIGSKTFLNSLDRFLDGCYEFQIENILKEISTEIFIDNKYIVHKDKLFTIVKKIINKKQALIKFINLDLFDLDSKINLLKNIKKNLLTRDQINILDQNIQNNINIKSKTEQNCLITMSEIDNGAKYYRCTNKIDHVIDVEAFDLIQIENDYGVCCSCMKPTIDIDTIYINAE